LYEDPINSIINGSDVMSVGKTGGKVTGKMEEIRR
jgi:hypothetical protein